MPQVAYPYTLGNGYYPLAPWAGLAVLVRLGRPRTRCGHRAAPEGRVTEALRAEWTKLRTLASTGWLLIGTVALTVAVSAAVAAATHVTAGAGGGLDPTKLSLTGIYLGQTVIAVLAVLAISEEYGTGMIRSPCRPYRAASCSSPPKPPTWPRWR